MPSVWEFDFLAPQFFPIHLTFVFVFGSLWGSFIGLCISRIPAGQSIVIPGSYCFACGTPIHWRDNIPLLSFWLLKGRCRVCGTVFSSRHFWIELLSGVLFAWAFWMRDYTFSLFPAWIFTGLLLIATFTDIDHWIIPDRISIGGAAIGIALAFIPFPPGYSIQYQESIVYWAGPVGGETYWRAPANAIFGAAFGYGLLWMAGMAGKLIFRKEAMGGGDLKLFACIGAFLGYRNCIYVLFAASMLGVTIGLTLIGIMKWRHRRSRIGAQTEQQESDAEALAEKAMKHLFPDGPGQDEGQWIKERNALLNVLSAPTQNKTFQHHLKFGPYLAVAGYLVMLYYSKIDAFVNTHMLFSGSF